MTEKTWQDKALGIKTDSKSGEISDDSEVIILMTTRNEFGDQIYGYLKIPYKNYAVVKELTEQNKGFDPRQYGEIIAAGRGMPTQEVEDEIAREHGLHPVTIKKTEPIPDNFAVQDMDDDDYPF